MCSYINHALLPVVAAVDCTTGNKTTHAPMSGVTTNLMTNLKECSQQVLAQSQSITELLLEGTYVDWINFDFHKLTSRLDSINVALIATNATQVICNMII